MITVIIPTRNRPNTLRRVYASYLESPSVSALIVVNDGSDVGYDAVLEEIAVFCAQRGVGFRCITLPLREGAPAARQRALETATTRYILFGDDDVMVSPGYADELLALVGDDVGPCVAGGRAVYLDADGREVQLRGPLFDKVLLVGNYGAVSGVRSVPFVHTFSLWDRRRTFDRGVRFFTGYRVNGYREETDPQVQVRARGLGDIVITDRAVFTHLSYAHIERGGQHTCGRLLYEWYVVRNDFLFMARHAAYFARTRGIWFIPWHMVAFLWWRVARGVRAFWSRR